MPTQIKRKGSDYYDDYGDDYYDDKLDRDGSGYGGYNGKTKNKRMTTPSMLCSPRVADGGGVNPIALIVAPIVALALLTAAAAVALAPVLVNINVGIAVGRDGFQNWQISSRELTSLPISCQRFCNNTTSVFSGKNASFSRTFDK